ncbi:MAG: TetR family transcriptional regulator [Deltaproteobacteria bacterium]|nr:TetR family transcriptional regulator [Deltaproteobacteria bacterium]HCH64566.1 TetR/AcrR family transcriptional regulator [Deltaproteobacteria bacterium]
MPRNQYHHGDLRSALLSAARRLVADHGPDGFTMARAAREAGVSSGAPYRHFPDRSALMAALAQQGDEELRRRMAVATEDIADPLEAFRQQGIVYTRFAVEEPGWFRVMSMPEYITVREDDPEIQAFWAPFAQFIQAHGPDDPLPPQHPLMAVFAGRALVHGLASLLVQGSLEPFGISRDRAGQLADAITRFLAMPPPGPPPGT